MKKKSKNLYDDLGVDPTADPATIKRAYRRKAKAAHPDKGGSHEEMSALTTAYSILSDPARRARYDEIGDELPLGSVEQSARTLLIDQFNRIIPNIAAGQSVNVIRMVEAGLTQNLNGLDQQRSQLRQGIDRLTKNRKKLRLKNGMDGDNWFTVLIDKSIQDTEGAVTQIEHKREVTLKAMEMLKQYEEVMEKGMPSLTLSPYTGQFIFNVGS